jgi:hypothetical protein
LDNLQVPKKPQKREVVPEQPKVIGKGGNKIDWHDYQEIAKDGQRTGIKKVN